jgi:hypothetical protein
MQQMALQTQAAAVAAVAAVVEMVEQAVQVLSFFPIQTHEQFQLVQV